MSKTLSTKQIKGKEDYWIRMSDSKPTKYGRYLVYRGGKIHFETWNNTGWAYNNNSITHWQPIPEKPIVTEK